MSTPSERMLRWYPTAWRARYGEELVALMEDTYGDRRRIPWRERMTIVHAGLRERLRRVAGGETGPVNELRGGALLVLWGWACFVVAGAGFAKLSEHWDQVTPPAVRHVPAIGFNATVGAATVGAIIVLIGAVLALPACLAMLQAGGWHQIRGTMLRAAAVVGVTVAYSLGVVLSAPAHSGPSEGIEPLGVIWAILVTVSIGSLTAATVAVARRLDLSRRVLRIEGSLALLLTVVMVVVLAGMALWWGAIARDTAILSGSGSGLFSTPGSLSMTAAAVLMVVGLATAATGAVRVVRSLRTLPDVSVD